MGERRRHHGPPGGDGLDEHPGRHLLARVVRQQHDIGPLHQPGELAGVEVAVVEFDDVRDAAVRARWRRLSR